MRLTAEGLAFNPPPTTASGGQATAMAIRVWFRGNRIKRRVAGERVSTILLEATPGAAALVLTDVPTGQAHALAVGQEVVLPRAKATIKAAAYGAGAV